MSTCTICLEDFELLPEMQQAMGHTLCILLGSSEAMTEILEDTNRMVVEAEDRAEELEDEIQSLKGANSDLNAELRSWEAKWLTLMSSR